jgi:hypothetical protein
MCLNEGGIRSQDGCLKIRSGLAGRSAAVPPNAASYLHRDGILGVRKLVCAFDWARHNGSNNLSDTPEGCRKLQHSKAPSAQKQKTCGIRRPGGAGSNVKY